MDELLFMGESPTWNCVKDFKNFIENANRSTTYKLQFFWYVGKASVPVEKGGAIVGDAPGSRQVISFKEHLPEGHEYFRGRPEGAARIIDHRGVLRSAVSFYYRDESEVRVDALLQDFTARAFPDVHERLRLNMIKTNGERHQNCYVHIYAVSNQRARSTVYNSNV